MSVLIHIAEIATLLALSYALGLGVGYGARRVSLGSVGAGAAALIPAERLAAAKGEVVPPKADEAPPTPEAVVAIADALATPEPPPPELAAANSAEAAARPEAAVGPVAAEIAATPEVFPAELDAKANPPAAALLALAKDELSAPTGAPLAPPEPAVMSAAPTPVLVATEPPQSPQPSAEPPVEAAPPLAPTPPAPPPEGWTVVARRDEAAPPEAPTSLASTARGPASPSSRPGVAWAGEIRGHAAPASELPPEPEPIAEPEIDAQSETPVAESTPTAEPPPPPPPSEWGSRTLGTTAPPNVGQAVAAAQNAVEAALARSGIDPAAPEVRDTAAFGKPAPMKSPLGGGRDDLKLIDGLKAEDEVMLNGIGVFHFAQIAVWDHKEVLWLENHILERGRVARENWQAQAAEFIRRRAEETKKVGV